MSDKRIELQRTFVKEAEDKLAACQRFCKKFGCDASKQKCESQTRIVESLKEQLESMLAQKEKQATSAPHQEKLGEKYKVLKNLVCTEEHWEQISECLKRPDLENDEERGIALELLVQKLRREALE